MKPRLIKKNTIRKNPEILIDVFLDWASYNGSYKVSINDILDMLHLSPQTYDHILTTTKNSTERDVIIGKLYDKYLEINGKFRRIDNLARSIQATDDVLNRRLTPIDYSDIIRLGWQYENFRWLIYKLIRDKDDITQYFLDNGINRYINTFMDSSMLEHYIFCIADPDSLYSMPDSTFNGLCKVVSYMLGVNSTFLNGITIYPILLDKHINSDLKLKTIELERLLLLHHVDNTFDMNDPYTRKMVGGCLIEINDKSYKHSIIDLEMRYKVNLTNIYNISSDFKKNLKYYNNFIRL